MNEENFSIIIRLRDLRKQHNLSQEELAEALGISRQSVISLEQGKFLPSLPLMLSMCQFFNSDLDELLEMPFKSFDKKVEDGKEVLIKNSDSAEGKVKTMPQEIEPWRPFREAVSLRDAMDLLVEDSVITPRGGTIAPRIDVKDQKDSILVKAELPGMKEDEVDVEISDGVLTISGEKKEEKEEKEEGYYHKESYSGAFSRSIGLPADVRTDKATAEMKDGVLNITLPKSEPKKATKLKVAKK